MKIIKIVTCILKIAFVRLCRLYLKKKALVLSKSINPSIDADFSFHDTTNYQYRPLTMYSFQTFVHR